MNLSNFEEYIDDVILERGLDYYKKGKIENIKEIEPNTFIAMADGTDTYEVTVTLNSNGDIELSNCDCPYDYGEFCKHQAALFYALSEDAPFKAEKPNKRKSTPKEHKEDLSSILPKLKKEELVSIILDFSKEYKVIEKQLLLKYSNGTDEIRTCKKMIREYIQSAKRGGFIEWRNVDYALQGAGMTLDKAKSKLEAGDTEGTVALCIAVLSIVVDMLQYSDDSNGSVGDTIRYSLDLIDEAVERDINHLNDTQQKKLFTAIMNEALHKRYDGWDGWRFNLLKTCINFCHKEELRNILEKQLQKFLVEIPINNWSSTYYSSEIKSLQLELIERFDGVEKAEKFIYQNIKYSDFREKAISIEMEKGNYDNALNLCLEGEKKDKQYPGLVMQWKEYRFQIYEKLGDVEKQRKLALEFVYRNDYEYYLKLKNLYNPVDWKIVLSNILETFENERYQPEIYERILIEENLADRLLEYCKRKPSYIERLYPYLIKDYFTDVNDLFIEFIKTATANATDRKMYKKVCKIIQTYKKVCGDTNAHKLIQELKEEYQRRPALLDELGKIK